MKFERISPADTAAAPEPERTLHQRLRGASLSSHSLLMGLLLFLLAGNQLLLLFLAVSAAIWLVSLTASTALFVFMLRLQRHDQSRVGIVPLLGCIAFAALIFALGGEGRLFYANVDWQIRDAVLRDMTMNAWPYAYSGRGAVEVLRAPIGMYLIPAVAGKLGGIGVAQAAMLVQNALLLGIVLALGSRLAETSRARVVMLVVVVVFSGLDFLGQLSVDRGEAMQAVSHLDKWAKIQFSSHITQAFWVPQHALAGWAGAILFMLWAKGRLPLTGFLVPIPFLALWSPLAMIGIVPFAAFAGFATLLRRELKVRDVAAPLFAAAIALPALIYLQAAGDSVGMRLKALDPAWWVYFQLLETMPFILGVALLAKGRQPWLLLCLSAAWLFFVPFVQIGTGVDFMMRASIPALAVLAILVAEALTSSSGDYREGRVLPRQLLIFSVALGSITGVHEVARAVLYRPAPLTRCELIMTTVYHAGPQAPAGMSTYLAPIGALPAGLRPDDVNIVPRSSGVRCWKRPWMVPR